MSNRRKAKPQPPAAVADATRHYRCGHCDSTTCKPRQARGVWHIEVRHDQTCPVLAGTVSRVPAARRALEAAGRPALYITTED